MPVPSLPQPQIGPPANAPSGAVPANAQRVLVRVLRELAAARGVDVQTLGEGWIYRLTRGGVTRYVHGYCFDLNTAATHAIACDKAATSDVLHAAGLPRVEHRLFLHPELAPYVKHPGNWSGMLAAFEAWGRDVVVKDNLGTGGRGVLRARTPIELEQASLTLFERRHSIAMSPFVAIDEEVRFVLLGGVCLAAYAKDRPSVVGDGKRTVLELLADRVSAAGVSAELARWLATLEPEAAAGLAGVPGAGEVRLLNWRHNLGQGASVRLLDDAGDDAAALRDLARQAAGALNLVFGSVDVVRVGGRAMVLEVNAGVMMEALAGIPGGEATARRVYALAMDRMFAP